MRPGAYPTGWLPGVAMPDANDELLTRVGDALAGLTGSRDAALVLAVSGGPDSMAMLDIARSCWAGSLYATTVDHGLRPESADEAAMVNAYCAAAGVAHATLRPPVPITGSLQSAARAARYALLNQHANDCGADFIVTAHHADDQLETMLMRLARGSGVDGLSGVRSRNGRIIRPLLGCRKAELITYCERTRLRFVSDPSNDNMEFDRVRMRAALASFDAIDPLMAVRSADALADAAEALDWMADREAQTSIIADDDGVLLILTSYPPGLLRRLVQRCLERVQPGIVPRGPQADRLIAALHSGEQTMIGDVLCRPVREGLAWQFTAAPKRGGVQRR